MSFFYNLGALSAKYSLEKSAIPRLPTGIGSRIGSGLGSAIGGMFDLGGVAAKGLGRAAGKGLTTPGLQGLTLGGLGLGASATNEGLGALASYSDLPIPHFGSSKERPLWSPHLTPSLIDPKVTGWGAAAHAASRPIQTARHFLGLSPKPRPEHNYQSYDPWTGGMKFTDEEIDISVDPRTGKHKVDLNPKMSPIFNQQIEALKAQVERMKAMGIPIPNMPGGASGSGRGFGTGGQQPSVLRSQPLTLADVS